MEVGLVPGVAVDCENGFILCGYWIGLDWYFEI